MTQAGRSKTALPAAILIVALAVLAISLVWAHRHKAAPAALPPDHPMLAGAIDPIATLEARATQQPGDGEAWHALAAQYFDGGRFDDAVRAYARAVQLTPGKAILWSALGEARVMASAHDPIPAEALNDFQRAIAIDPRDPRARYFLAADRDLKGDHRGAIDDWLALLADTPPGAAWENDLKRTIAQVGRMNGIAVDAALAAVPRKAVPLAPAAPLPAPAALPGPSAADIQSAAALSPQQQQQMGAGMVARLEQRLQSDPANLDGWVMLIRSRMTLGQPDAARAALHQAIAHNPEEAQELQRQAAMLGVKN